SPIDESGQPCRGAEGFRTEYKLRVREPGMAEETENLVQFHELGRVVNDDQAIGPHASEPGRTFPYAVNPDQDQRTSLRHVRALPREAAEGKVRKGRMRVLKSPKRHVGAGREQRKVVDGAVLASAEGIGERVEEVNRGPGHADIELRKRPLGPVTYEFADFCVSRARNSHWVSRNSRTLRAARRAVQGGEEPATGTSKMVSDSRLASDSRTARSTFS